MHDQIVLLNLAVHISTSNMAANPQFARLKVPLFCDTQAGSVDTLGNVDTLGQLTDVLQWSLDTIKDGAHDTGSQLH